MTAPARRPGAPRRSSGDPIDDTNVALRAADRARLRRAAELRPGASAGDVRSEVIALGVAALEAGWRLEGPRVLDATGGPTPRGHAVAPEPAS